jgi:hypothetical protein
MPLNGYKRMRRIRRFHVRAALAWLVLFVVLLVAGRSRLLRDPDTFWHIAVGREILASGEMVEADSFTFTFEGKPWIANQWLSECSMAIVHQWAGLDGLVLLVAGSMAFLLTWIGWRLVNGGVHWMMAGLLVAMVFGATAYNLHVRPNFVTICLFVPLVALLRDFERGRIPAARLGWLVPLFVVWTNMHGGVLGGLGTVVVVVAGWTALWIVGAPSPMRTSGQAVALWAIVVLSLAGTLANPYGLEMHRAWLTILGSSLPELVIEHAPLDVRAPAGMMIVALGVVWMVLWLTTGRRIFTVTWILPAIWLGLAFTRIRHGPLFAMAAAVLLPDVLQASSAGRWLEGRGWFRPNREPVAGPEVSHAAPAGGGIAWLLAIPAVLMVLPVADVAFDLSAQPGRGWARPHQSVWPVCMIPALESALHADGVGGTDSAVRIFNEQEYGGFLIANFPQARVFIDGRCELFGEEFLRTYMRARSDGRIIENWESEYEFRLALVRSGSSLDRHFSRSPGWIAVRSCDKAVLYRRRENRSPAVD